MRIMNLQLPQYISENPDVTTEIYGFFFVLFMYLSFDHKVLGIQLPVVRTSGHPQKENTFKDAFG